MLEHWEGLTRSSTTGGSSRTPTRSSVRSGRLQSEERTRCSAADEGGGETWAILASLLNTAKLNGVDPETWLTDVLERMVSGRTTNDRLHELLAWNWKPETAQPKMAA